MQKLHRDIVLKDLAGKPMKAMDILAIYIKYLKDALLKEINNCSNDFQFFYNDIDFVLVVPASCGDGAKMFMHEAAIQVGYISIYRSLCVTFQAKVKIQKSLNIVHVMLNVFVLSKHY